jgi:hypothetical protein
MTHVSSENNITVKVKVKLKVKVKVKVKVLHVKANLQKYVSFIKICQLSSTNCFNINVLSIQLQQPLHIIH